MRTFYASTLRIITVLLASFLAACATTNAVVGIYGAKLPAASSPGRLIHLELKEDYRAELSTDYLNDRPAIVETGRWEKKRKDEVIVTLTGKADRMYEKPKILTFAPYGDGFRLTEYDREDWGSEGLSLQKEPEIIGRLWYLVEIQYSDDTVMRPSDPARYTLELFENGTVLILADCNRGTGSFILAGKSLTFQGIGYTGGTCLPGTLFHRYTKALETAASAMIRDGHLYIAMSMDSGIMKFVQSK